MHTQGAHTGGRGKQARAPGSFNLLPAPCFKSKQACALHKRTLGFLQPSCKPHWISNQLTGVTFPVLDVRDRVPNMWLEPLAPQGGSLNLYNLLLFCDLSYCAGSDPIASFPFLPSPCGYFLSLGCNRAFLLTSGCFSENWSTCRCIFDVCMGRGELSSSYSTILISSHF